MNKIYAVFRNASGALVVGSEVAKRNRKSSGRSRSALTVLAGLGLLTQFGAASVYAADLVIDNTTNITTTAASDHAIPAIAAGADNVLVTNSGTLATSGTAAHGIQAVTGTGDVEVSNTVDITTSGVGGMGIRATTDGNVKITSTGDITTTNTGAWLDNAGIAQPNEQTHAILGLSTGNGDVTINASGKLETHGFDSSGVRGWATGSGTVDVTYEGPSINVHGDDADGIYAENTGSGDVKVTTKGTGTIETHGGDTTAGAYAYGIVGQSTSGNVDIANTMNIKTGLSAVSSGILAYSSAGGNINVANSGDIRTEGAYSHGINASSTAGNGNVIVSNSANITTDGVGAQGILAQSAGGDAKVTAAGNILTNDASLITGSSTRSHGIFASTGGAAGKAASIVYDDANGSVTVNASSDSDYNIVAALRAETSGGANASVVVNNAQSINANGSNTAGIQAIGLNTGATTGNVKVDFLSGTINAGSETSLNADGIHAINYGNGNVDVTSRGNITVKGNNETRYGGNWGSEAIYTDAAGDGNATVTAGGTIQVLGTGAGGSAGAVAATHGAGTASLTFDDANGSITTVADAAPAIKTAALGSGDAVVNVNAGKISTLGAANAVEVISAQTQTVTVGAQGDVSGGYGSASAISLAGVLVTDTPRASITNAGKIGASSDRAIATNFVDGARLDITNQAGGEITGYVDLGNGTNSLDNAGTWNLRNLSASTAGGLRDTLAVAKADFGTGTNNAITNSGTLALQGGTAAHVDASGLFNTGYAANTLASNGAVQGHILGVQTFTNSGTIDLGANPAVGDVLRISGSQAVGSSGGGTFVSNGGTLKVDTVLNEGGANSQSDMLVVDRTAVGAGGATRIKVNNVGGAGALTQGNGIELVRVLEGSQSADGAFVLDGRAVAGAYDYRLHKGSETDAGNGNWYLSNTAPESGPSDDGNKSVEGGATKQGGDASASAPGTPMYRPEAGAYLANQSAATGMFAHTLHDRLGEPNFAERGRTENDKPTAGWARLQGRKTDSKAASGQLDADTDSWVLQGGLELGRWNSGDSRFHTGVMFGTGSAKTDVSSNVTGYKASGKVDGNSVGVYGTWYADATKPTGLYVDSWLQYGRYNNEVQGQYLAPEKYKSNTLSGSVEAGYAFELSNDGKRAIYFEPQAQAIYTDYSAGTHLEANGTMVRPTEAGGLLTRLGARVYGHEVGAQKKFQPFVEANWWHANKDNAVSMDLQQVTQNLPRDTFEIKVGAEAELVKGWTTWGHVGLQKGSNDYKSVSALVGVKRVW